MSLFSLVKGFSSDPWDITLQFCSIINITLQFIFIFYIYSDVSNITNSKTNPSWLRINWQRINSSVHGGKKRKRYLSAHKFCYVQVIVEWLWDMKIFLFPSQHNFCETSHSKSQITYITFFFLSNYGGKIIFWQDVKWYGRLQRKNLFVLFSISHLGI